jgi:predicted nucleic acid-binding protein
MKFVVDTNVLFTFFWKESFTKGVLVDQDLEFFAPEFALREINEHRNEILEKTGISLEEFKKLRTDIAICVEFIPLEEYSEFLQRASSIPDPDDVDFIALALKLDLPIWSNDSHLKEQSKVKVFSTKELINFLSKAK